MHFCNYRRTFLKALCFFLLGGVTAQLEAQILEKEKISEGQYVRMKNGDKIPGSEQSWTLWRIPSVGYELEDHFELTPNPAAQVLSQMPSKNLSPELRRELAAEVKQTDLIVRYGMDRKPMSVSVKGKKLQDGTKVDVLKCGVDGQQVRCEGNIRQTKFRSREQRELFYAMPFPMLLSMWLLPDTLKPATMQRQLSRSSSARHTNSRRLKKPFSLWEMRRSRSATINSRRIEYKLDCSTRAVRN